MADVIHVTIDEKNFGDVWRKCRIDALWWAWVSLDETHPGRVRARELIAGWLLELGQVP
jgi:hypothetical protein